MNRKQKALLLGAGIVATGTQAAAEEPIKFNGWAGLSSAYVARPGFIPVGGPVMQAAVSGGKDNYGCFAWQNTDLHKGKVTEIDIGCNASTPGYELLGGKVGFRAGSHLWVFPNAPETANSLDVVVEGGAHYSGPVEADVTATRMLGQGNTEAGWMFQGTVAKPFSNGITPSVTFTNLQNFYGVSGNSNVTGGVNFSKPIGPVTASVTVNYQHSLNDKIRSELYGMVKVGGRF